MLAVHRDVSPRKVALMRRYSTIALASTGAAVTTIDSFEDEAAAEDIFYLQLCLPEADTCPKARRIGEHNIWTEENAVRVLLLRPPPPPTASFRNSLMKRKGPQNVVPDVPVLHK